MTRLRDDSGQALVFVVLFVTGLVAMLVLVLTVGTWFRTHRQLQTAVDASALAAAQQLPCRTTGDALCAAGAQPAAAVAADYLSANQTENPTALADNVPCGTDPSASAPSCSVTFPAASPCVTGACVRVDSSQTPSGPFASFVSGVLGLVGMDPVTVRAHAQAAIGSPSELKDVVPVAVKSTAACTIGQANCFGVTKLLNFNESLLSSSSFGIVDLARGGSSPAPCPGSSNNGGPGSSLLTCWIDQTYGGYLPINVDYPAVTGQKIGPISSSLDAAATARRTLLFPVFDTANNAAKTFHVIGWSAFVIDVGGIVSWKNDNPSCTPNCKVLRGHFTTFLASGISNGTPSPGTNDFGVNVIWLSE